MRILLLLALVGAAAGCGQVQRVWTNLTGSLTYKCAQTGVLYVQSDSGLAALLDRDGKTVACTE